VLDARAIAKIDHPIYEPTLVEQREIQPDVTGNEAQSTSDCNRSDEQVILAE
jgi:hypothetical protein